MRKLTVIISLIMCALLVFGCAKAPEQPSAPEEQEASRPDDSEPLWTAASPGTTARRRTWRDT